MIIPTKTRALAPVTKFQLCQYKTKEGAAFRQGIAWLNCGFGTYDVRHIVDLETAKRAISVWDYTLIDTPISCIDSVYST